MLDCNPLSGDANVVSSPPGFCQETIGIGEDQYRRLIDSQTDLVVKLDKDGRLEFVSPSFCEMFCATDAELYGTVFKQHVHIGDLERIAHEWQKLFAAPWTTEFEHRSWTNKGNRWLGWVLKALRDEKGEIFEIVGIGRDVTRRRNTEEKTRQTLSELAHSGRIQSMGEMATTLAHELNQPLAAILSFSQAGQRVVKNQCFDHEELVFALDRIAANATRAGDIIGRMRGFIRKDGSRTEESSINELILQAMNLVNPEITHLEIDTKLDLSECLPNVRVDPVQIQQVVLNLIRNAMEAIESNPDGEQRITISTRMRGPGSIETTVADTGPGLSQEVADNPFEAFVTTKSEGMGVGLSICNSIIEAHGGWLEVGGGAACGAIFSFVLPSTNEEREQ